MKQKVTKLIPATLTGILARGKRSETARLAILSQAASRLLVSDFPEQLVQPLAEQVMAELNCQFFFNFIPYPEKGCLRLNAYAGIPAAAAREILLLDYGVAVCGTVAQRGKRIVKECIQSLDDPIVALVKSFGVRAYACHPLLSPKGNILGTLSFGTIERDSFHDDELALMQTLSNQLAVAFQRIQAERELRKLNAELEQEIMQGYAAQQQIREQAELLGNANDYIMVRDMDSRVVYWNLGAEKGYGFMATEAVGRITHELLKTEFPDPLAVINEKLLEWGHWEGELLHTRKDGVRVIVESHWTLKRDEAGKPVSIMEINNDITAKKQAAEQLQDANRRLEQFNIQLESMVAERTAQLQEINAKLQLEIAERQAAQEKLATKNQELAASERRLQRSVDELSEINKELTSFTNSIAHDFRSPMVNLQGFTSELGRSLTELTQVLDGVESLLPIEVQTKVAELLNEDVTDARQFINLSVNRLDRLAKSLLELSLIGRREMTFTEVDLGKLVNRLIKSHHRQIAGQKLRIAVGALPKIQTNYPAMEQIIDNLLDNAIKYTEPSRPGKIEVTCLEKEYDYMVSIKDNGRGIASVDHEKIFEIFRRSGKYDQPGDGLGLAYVRALIRKLGGKIWLESELGTGTQMMFTVPKIQ